MRDFIRTKFGKVVLVIIAVLMVCCCVCCVFLVKINTKNKALKLQIDAYKTVTGRLENEVSDLQTSLKQSNLEIEEYKTCVEEYQNEIITLNEQIEEYKAEECETEEYTYNNNIDENDNDDDKGNDNDEVIVATTTDKNSSKTESTKDNENRVYLGKYTITHYCCERYPHICGDGQGLTSSGVPVQAGVSVAVDSSQIALGTELYIEGYGTRIAQDTGGAVNGNRIDVAVATHEEALRLGTVTRDVWMVV